MKSCKDVFLSLRKKVAINRNSIFKFALALVALAGVSFLVESYGFGHSLRTLGKQDAGIFDITKTEVATSDFNLDSQGIFVSSAESATLTLSTNGRYVQNLELFLAGNPAYDIAVKYIDPKTGQEIVLNSDVQKSMEKNGFNFLHLLVFHIQNKPEAITVLAATPVASISDIKIDNSYHFNFYRFLFLFLALVLILVFILFRKIVGRKPEYVFFAVAMVCGTLLSLSEPHSFVSWDEAIHYQKADSNSLGGIIKNGVKNIYSATNSVPISYSTLQQDSIDNYFDNQAATQHKSKGFSIFDFSLLDTYNQLGHMPAGLALMLGRLFQLPNHLVFVFGRWINALVYSLVVFFAIRRLKTGKMLMSVVALFPTAIFLASNYGYDYWVTAFTLLALSYLFTELQQPEKKITRRNVVIILASFVIGLGPKAIYFPLMLLVFLLKKEKFESFKRYKKFFWASVFSILLVVSSFMVPFVIGGPGKGDRRGGGDVNSAMQVKFILTNPAAYSKILFNFMLDYLNPKNSAGFMTFFAYLGSIKGFLLLGITLVVAAVTDKNEYDRLTSDLKTKSWLLVIFLATVALISTALYVSFTPVGSFVINGVQPRYLIPLIFPLLFVIGSSRVKNPFNRNVYNFIIFGVMAFVSLQGIWDLVISLHY